jgi:DNA-binding CsgD family transcriptional regulator
MGVDLLDLVESAYDVDAPEPEWLRGIARAGMRLFGRGLGGFIYTYTREHHDPEPAIRTLQFSEGFDAEWFSRWRLRMGAGSEPGAPPQWGRWFDQACGTAQTTRGIDALLRTIDEFGGAVDMFALNGRDPEGFGIRFGAPLPRPMRLGSRQRELYTRVSAHFAAGYRLRRRLAGRRLAPDGAEAVLKPGGKLLHANGDARATPAREELVRATRRIDRARSRAGRKDAEAATRSWRALVDGRWTLVDYSERNGERFVLAKRNDLQFSEPPKLSAREQQILAFAALDHTNKEIAYELGLSAATVRVLMSRAARKLRAAGREDAIEIFRQLTKPPSL